MNQIRKAKTITSGETALERLSERESLRMVPFIQRMMLEEKRRFESYHHNIPYLYYRSALLCFWGQHLQFADELAERIRANSASDEQSADMEDSESV